MTVSQRWLAFSGILSVGAGFLAGMTFSRGRATCCPEVPIGRIYRLDDNMYIDQVGFEYLKAHSVKSIFEGPEACLAFFGRMMCFRKFNDGAVFPDQQGAVYVLRRVGDGSKDAQADVEAAAILEHMRKFGLLEDGGRWKDWSHLEAKQRAAQAARASKGKNPEPGA